MNDLFLFLILGFAAYRVTAFFVFDRGPFGIFEKIRVSFGKRASKGRGHFSFEVAEGLNCSHCVGVWVSFGLAFVPGPDSLITFFVYWLGLAGFQSFLSAFTE